jgi:formylglycine-generating enzyme required for sulfatase activity
MEWEQACAGAGERAFPYGPRYDAASCVSAGVAAGAEPLPAGSHAACVTPAGVADLSGNVAEWTDSAYDADTPRKVIRGGYWRQAGDRVSCRARDYFLPGQGGAAYIGFRCCL